MKVEYRKDSIVIIPEKPADEVYLESVLGLMVEGDTATVTRVAPHGFPKVWSYAQKEQTDE